VVAGFFASCASAGEIRRSAANAARRRDMGEPRFEREAG
jgi:hypothetical protein